MDDEMRANPQLMEEYEQAFDSEEKVAHEMKITSENDFTIKPGVVEIDSILIPDPIKKARKETYLGLSTSVAELGIINPIHVMVSEGYSDWVQEHPDEEYEGYKYILLDGFRRIWGAYKNGKTRTNAIIWDFKDKDKGVDLATVLSLVIGKHQRRSWGEIWYLYQLLEIQSAMSPGTLEYLLSLEPGDAMKLKDIMSCEYTDVKEDLLTNKKDLTQAYNMLQKYRKEEDTLLKEDSQGISELNQAEGLLEEQGENRVLSNEEVSEILEMDDGDFTLQADDFDEMLGMDVETQKVGERHPISKELKAETLARDGYNCVCCNSTQYLPMRYKLSLLQSHHKVAVAHGGPDTAENIATVCMSCHTLIHCLLWSGLKFGMSKEDFDELPEEERERFGKVMQIAKKDWQAAQRLGKSSEDIKKEYKNPSQFKMPGTDMNENASAIKETGGLVLD